MNRHGDCQSEMRKQQWINLTLADAQMIWFKIAIVISKNLTIFQLFKMRFKKYANQVYSVQCVSKISSFS